MEERNITKNRLKKYVQTENKINNKNITMRKPQQQKKEEIGKRCQYLVFVAPITRRVDIKFLVEASRLLLPAPNTIGW